MLAFADDEDVPATGEGDVVATESDEPTPEPEPAPEPAPVKGSGDVYYKNCDAARAAGAAPLYRGDPGYRPKMDRDGDGVACE
nr:excalibur calcium-binding domain-containing protein [Brachybacterium muris]